MEHGSTGVPADDLIAIRPATADDLEASLQLFEEVVAERRWLAAEPPADRRARAEEWLSILSSERGTAFAATAGGAYAGEVTLQPAEPGTLVLGMMVARAWRRRKLGSRLIEAAIAWAQERPEVRRIDLAVFPHNVPAICLYLKFGFVESVYNAEAIPRRAGGSWDVLVMRREFDREVPSGGRENGGRG